MCNITAYVKSVNLYKVLINSRIRKIDHTAHEIKTLSKC